MSRWLRRFVWMLVGPFAFGAACSETGQRRTTFSLFVEGTPASDVLAGDWNVRVVEARLAFGPLYLCASRDAGLEPCALSVAELLGAASFDALDSEIRAIGTMEATSGSTVRSAMWDYGRSWRLGETRPRAIDGAVDGEHSLVLTVRATHEASNRSRTYRFVLDVDAASQPSGTLAVRTRLAEHRIAPDEVGLVVRFDPTLWASMLDYDALAALPEASPRSVIDVPLEHPARDALTAALAATGLPTFVWRRSE